MPHKAKRHEHLGRKDARAETVLLCLQFSTTGRAATASRGLLGSTSGPPTTAQSLYHKPHGLSQTTQPGTGGGSFLLSILSLPTPKGCTFYSCCSLSIPRKRLSAPAALPVQLDFYLHHQHHHSSRPIPVAFLEFQPPQQAENSAHQLFLSRMAQSPLPQPLLQLEELSRGSSLALDCLLCSRIP